MKEIDASIDRGEGGEEKEKERKEKESVYTEIFSILNKNGLGKGKTDLKTILKTTESSESRFEGLDEMSYLFISFNLFSLFGLVYLLERH